MATSRRNQQHQHDEKDHWMFLIITFAPGRCTDYDDAIYDEIQEAIENLSTLAADEVIVGALTCENTFNEEPNGQLKAQIECLNDCTLQYDDAIYDEIREAIENLSKFAADEVIVGVLTCEDTFNEEPNVRKSPLTADNNVSTTSYSCLQNYSITWLISCS
ncbi:hypothetical protein RHSIM_Rhsim07G0218700 [Rhododendron simsii]|uniref:Uncharacterized protein n=1 Tax=Rhododendron simsii TaxID=118357 RepID=A0A834GQ89_RHOSS|nr:hypothetical protein RHSIM_Rhsim07G0218700 [Rhododendron simsii]